MILKIQEGFTTYWKEIIDRDMQQPMTNELPSLIRAVGGIKNLFRIVIEYAERQEICSCKNCKRT